MALHAAASAGLGRLPHAIGFAPKLSFECDSLVDHLVDGLGKGVAESGHLRPLSVHAVIRAPALRVGLTAARRAAVRALLGVRCEFGVGDPAPAVVALGMPVQLPCGRFLGRHGMLLSEGFDDKELKGDYSTKF